MSIHTSEFPPFSECKMNSFFNTFRRFGVGAFPEDLGHLCAPDTGFIDKVITLGRRYNSQIKSLDKEPLKTFTD